MENSDGPRHAEDLSRAPRTGLRLMMIILIAMALLAIYANVQKSRREKIESVTIIPAPSVTPAATSPTP